MVRFRGMRYVYASIFLPVSFLLVFNKLSENYKFPQTVRVLNDAQMRNIIGGSGNEKEEPKKCIICEVVDRSIGVNMHVSIAEGALWTLMIRETVDPCGLNIISEYEYDSVGRATKLTS